MREFELIFRHGGLDRCRQQVERLAAMASVVRLTLDANGNRALLACAEEGESELLAAIWALRLPLVALLAGTLRDAGRAKEGPSDGDGRVQIPSGSTR